MFEVIVYGLIWCFAIYGILVMIQEITRNNTYRKIVENYIRELSCGRNFYNNLVVIDLDSEDETLCILKEMEKENVNLKILNRKEGEEYLKKQIS